MTRWTDEEEEYLKKHWSEKSIHEIAEDLDRTYKSVRNKGKKLVEGKKEPQRSEGSRWSAEEESYLEDHWNDMKISDIADNMDNRTYSAIRNKAKDLGLSSKDQVREDQEPWSEEEEEFLKENWEQMSTSRLQDELDRSGGSIRYKASSMNLPKKQEFDYWTDEEEEYLRDNYANMPVRAIANELENRSEDSVEAKARKMGLVRYSNEPVNDKDHVFSSANHEINTDSDEFKLVPIGDIHLGHPACQEDMLFDVLDDLEEDDTPYGIVLMGDLWEGATKDSPNFQFSMKYPPQKQYQNILAIFDDYSDKILGAVVGNHEDFARNITGYQKMKDFCREIEVPFLQYTGAINLSINGLYYRVLATHGSSGARTWGGRINALTRMNNVLPDADLFLYGHTHSKAVVTDAKYRSVGNTTNKRKRTYVLTGSFVDYPGTYADKRNYPPSSLGIVPVSLGTKDKKIEAKI